MNEIASRHKGHVVKMLGDGVHFHFEDPHDAVTASLEIVDTVRPAGLPPAHVGVNAGPMIYEEGDYFGRPVVVARRLCDAAGPGQVLVAGAREDGLETVGRLALKGLREMARSGESSPLTDLNLAEAHRRMGEIFAQHTGQPLETFIAMAAREARGGTASAPAPRLPLRWALSPVRNLLR